MTRAKLINIEGIDGSGKATQSDMLVKRLEFEGYDVDIMSFPTYGTPMGDIVGDCYLGRGNRIESGSWFEETWNSDPRIASGLFALNRLENIGELFRKMKDEDYIVLDRYVASNMGHQCGKLFLNPDSELSEKGLNRQRELLRDWIYKLEFYNFGLPEPSLTIVCDMSEEIAQRLIIDTGNMPDTHENDLNHLKNARKSYLELAEHYKWPVVECFKDESPRDRKEIGEEIYCMVKGLG